MCSDVLNLVYWVFVTFAFSPEMILQFIICIKQVQELVFIFVFHEPIEKNKVQVVYLEELAILTKLI
jgi:hypothetical protein